MLGKSGLGTFARPQVQLESGNGEADGEGRRGSSDDGLVDTPQVGERRRRRQRGREGEDPNEEEEEQVSRCDEREN